MTNDQRNRRSQSHQTHQKNKKFEANFAGRGIHLNSVEGDDVVDENEPKKISQKNKTANDKAMKLINAEFCIKKEMRLKETKNKTKNHRLKLASIKASIINTTLRICLVSTLQC